MGCIIAGLESIPYAYMIPMASVLEDIHRSMTEIPEALDHRLRDSEPAMPADGLKSLPAKRSLSESRPPAINEGTDTSGELEPIESISGISTAFNATAMDVPSTSPLEHKEEPTSGIADVTFQRKNRQVEADPRDFKAMLSPEAFDRWQTTGRIRDEEISLVLRANNQALAKRRQRILPPHVAVHTSAEKDPARDAYVGLRVSTYFEHFPVSSSLQRIQ